MRTTVKSLVFDEENNLLILTRSNSHPNYANEDDLPGGEKEENETSLQAASREIFEEIALTLNPSEFQEVYRKVVDADVCHIILICRVSGVKPAVKLSWEHSSYAWTCIDRKYHLKSRDDYIATVNEWLASNNPIRESD